MTQELTAELRRRLYDMNRMALLHSKNIDDFREVRGGAKAYIAILEYLEGKDAEFQGQEVTPDGEE